MKTVSILEKEMTENVAENNFFVVEDASDDDDDGKPSKTNIIIISHMPLFIAYIFIFQMKCMVNCIL